MFAVYHHNFRITKEPLTEYEALNKKLEWERIFKPVDVRPVQMPIKVGRSKKRSRYVLVEVPK